MSNTSSGSDRRQDLRAQLRTVVNIYTDETMAKDPMEFIRGWSEDVSATGAKIITADPLEEKRVWMKFLMPGSEPCFIEAEIMRGDQIAKGPFQARAMNWYGVRFQRLLSEKEFMELAMSYIGKLTAAVPNENAAERTSLRA